MMKNKMMVLSCVLALVFFLGAVSLAGAQAEPYPKVGQVLGAVKFAKPLSDGEAQYLGLEKAGEFTIKDVKSPYILIEQFNTTCPHCMHQAPGLNKLFNLVQQDSALKDKVKFMSVGQNNDDSAVKMWKAFHKVPFPVLPDPNSALGKALTFSSYPVSMLVDKSGKILWIEVGAFESADEVFTKIKAIVK